jgi:arginine/serine-rich splicing factor 1/9
MREAGDVCYADVSKDGTGVVEFIRQDDMKYAVRKLNNTKFRSHEGETSYITIKEDSRGGGGDRDSRSRSRSYTPPAKSRSSRRSQSQSPGR